MELADTALYHIDIELATRAYQQMSDVGVVLSLQELQVLLPLSVPHDTSAIDTNTIMIPIPHDIGY